MRRQLFAAFAVATVWACGGATFSGGDGAGDGGTDGGSSSSSGSSSSGASSSSTSGGSSGSSGSSSGSSSGGTGRVPLNHRPNDNQCYAAAPAGTCNLGGAGTGLTCSKDTDCADAGVNGRCIESMGGAITCRCTSDGCAGDVSCPAGQTCACHGSPYTGGAGNACVPGNCRVDADCGTGGYCSPSDNANSCGGLAGYYCHTPSDQCTDDSDCASSTSGPQVCAYSATSGSWKCQQQLLCP